MRVLSLTLIILWVLIPQVVCFLPNEQMTEMEMECCKHMAGDCGQANMQEHKCCAGVVKPDAAIVTAVHRTLLPHTAVAPPYISEAINFSRVIAETAAIVGRNIHPPPGDPNASLVVLRI